MVVEKGKVGTIVDWDKSDDEYDAQTHVKLPNGKIVYLGTEDVEWA